MAMPLALAWEKPRRWERDRRGSAGLRTWTQGDEGGRLVWRGGGRHPSEGQEGQAQRRAGRVAVSGHRTLQLSLMRLARELCAGGECNLDEHVAWERTREAVGVVGAAMGPVQARGASGGI